MNSTFYEFIKFWVIDKNLLNIQTKIPEAIKVVNCTFVQRRKITTILGINF
jgi:hypothetical protein